MSKVQVRLLKTVGIVVGLAALGLGAHFLIKAIVALHS